VHQGTGLEERKMPKSAGYIDRGDRVKVRNVKAFGAHGIVISNNGWGRCEVRLDDGRTLDFMNVRDLIYEDEELTGEPETDTAIVP
jgi:hypothetical protein